MAALMAVKFRECVGLRSWTSLKTAPGEEAQVDYGTGPMVRDPQTGKMRLSGRIPVERASDGWRLLP